MKRYKQIVSVIIVVISFLFTYGSSSLKQENKAVAVEDSSSLKEMQFEAVEEVRFYYVINENCSVDPEQIKYDTIVELFGDFDSYMNNDSITLKEMDEYKETLNRRLKDAYSKSNNNMIELIKNECGPIEVQFMDVYSPLCIIKMSDTQASILSVSNLAIYCEPFINIKAELE